MSITKIDNFFDNSQLHLIQHAQGGQIIGQVVNQIGKAEPSATPTFGSTVIYKFKKSGDDVLDDEYLIIDISAITGTGGTYIRGVNALGLFMFKAFRLKQNNENVKVIYPDNVMQNIKYYCNSDEYATLSQQLGIYSQTDRNTLAGASQRFAIPLKLLFAVFSKALDMASIKGDLELHAELRGDVQHCIQTDKTLSTFSITNTYLDLQYIKPQPIILNTMRKMYNEKGGLSAPWFDITHTLLEKSIALGETNVQFSLPSLQHCRIIDIYFFIVATSLRDTVLTSDYTDTFIAITDFSLKSGGKYLNFGLESNITKSYYDKVILPRLDFVGWKNILSGTSIENAYVISFANDHDSETSETKKYHGGRVFAENDVVLEVNFSALAANSKIIALVREAGRSIVSKGEIKSL